MTKGAIVGALLGIQIALLFVSCSVNEAGRDIVHAIRMAGDRRCP